MSYVETAFDITQTKNDLVILLGIEPDEPEAEYGWIEPVSLGLTKNPDALSWVRRFWEKPTPEIATKLMARGCLWNSFVMVGKVSAFLEMIRRASPDLYGRFRAIEPDLGTDNEQDKARSLYSQLADINFSRQILAARPRDLAVLPVTGLRWRDLGKPRRVLSTLADIGVKPAQAHVWNSASRLEATLT
jgi:mannose-1-phosphate guanylyltransferase